MKQAASILLVDDHPVFRQGLAAILRNEEDLEVVAEASDGQIALELIREHAPDIVVMDISMPKLDGIEATRQILAEFPDTKVVALSVHSSKRFVRGMLQAGAAGYILKESVPKEMIDGIRTVLAGDVYLSKTISGVVVAEYKQFLAETDQPENSFLGPILGMKFQRPPISADIVPRGRLLKMLEEGSKRGLTLISAPAGYGKSILASQWSAVCQCRSAWLALDEGFNDLRLFLRYLFEAIQQVFPSMPVQSPSLLQATSLPPKQVLTGYVLNDLEQLEEPLVLVLDDYHRIHQTAVHDLLNNLLHHSSPLLHLMLLTRNDPPVLLSRLRAQGQLTEITMDHLRFTEAETRDFLERVLHVTIDEHTASVLEDTIEGWVTGLRLAVLSLGQKWDPQRFVSGLTKRSHYVKEYLIDEVLSQVSPAIGRYLMETSILERFCAPLCEVFRTLHDPPDKISEGYLSGQAFIEWLEKTHLFVTPLDETHHWLRCHRLFRQLLQNQLKQHRSVEEIVRLHTRASTWFAENGLIDEALKHSLAAGDIAAAMHLVARHGHTLLNDQQGFVLSSHRSRFRIKVLALQAMVYDSQQDEFAALKALTDALTLAESAGFIRLFVDLGPQMADLLNRLSKQNIAIDYIERILAAFDDRGLYTKPTTSSSPELSPPSNEEESLEASGMQAVVSEASTNSPDLSLRSNEEAPFRASDMQAVVSESPLRRPASAGDQTWIVESLTDRELEILDLLAQRLQNKEIAETLFISNETVKKHLYHIYQKLNVTTRRQAVAKARDLGLLSHP